MHVRYILKLVDPVAVAHITATFVSAACLSTWSAGPGTAVQAPADEVQQGSVLYTRVVGHHGAACSMPGLLDERQAAEFGLLTSATARAALTSRSGFVPERSLSWAWSGYTSVCFWKVHAKLGTRACSATVNHWRRPGWSKLAGAR